MAFVLFCKFSLCDLPKGGGCGMLNRKSYLLCLSGEGNELHWKSEETNDGTV